MAPPRAFNSSPVTPASNGRPARTRKRTKKGKELDLSKSSPLIKTAPAFDNRSTARSNSSPLRNITPAFASSRTRIPRDKFYQAPETVPYLAYLPTPSRPLLYSPSLHNFALKRIDMAEDTNPIPAEANAGRPYYDQQLASLQKALRTKANLEAKLAKARENIYNKETDYLESTPNGNIVTGFENYTKGTAAGAGASRRRGMATDNNRIFSASDVTYNPNAESPAPSSTSTPVQTAPTPIATSSFLKTDSASNDATPTSSTSANKTGTGAKKNKRSAGDDSETDTREFKKSSRTASGVPRK